jgi:hypothetical protein
LRRDRHLDKARSSFLRSRKMIAIAVIAIFIVGIAVLNRVEFGRFD